MFATKRRLIATICIVGFLVVSFGMFIPSTEAHHGCAPARYDCCSAIWAAKQICGMFPNSGWCQDQYDYANRMCAIAASACGTFSCSDWQWGQL